MFIAGLFTITKIWKQPICPSVDEWIKSCGMYGIYMCMYVYIHTHTHTHTHIYTTELLLTHKK